MIHMVDVGERSGELEPMLAKVAETYDEQVESAVTRLTALLEPILILLMVGIVLVHHPRDARAAAPDHGLDRTDRGET